MTVFQTLHIKYLLQKFEHILEIWHTLTFRLQRPRAAHALRPDQKKNFNMLALNYHAAADGNKWRGHEVKQGQLNVFFVCLL